MNSLEIGVIVFACTFGSALLGAGLRRFVPERHLAEDSKDAIKVAVAVVATLAALVVGLLTSGAKTTLDTKDTELKQISSRITLLNNTLVQYGPEAAGLRQELKLRVQHAIAAIWDPRSKKLNNEAFVRGPGMLSLQAHLLQLVPQTDAQRWLKSSALQLANEIEEKRILLIQQKDGNIRWPLLAVMTFWFAIIFGSFGLFAPANVVVVLVFLTSSLSVATALYLIVQMDQPYSGYMQISSAPLQLALDQIANTAPP